MPKHKPLQPVVVYIHEREWTATDTPSTSAAGRQEYAYLLVAGI